MSKVTVEAIRDRVIITGQSADDVREEINTIFKNCTAAFADFTSPVRQADGAYVATGLVRLCG